MNKKWIVFVIIVVVIAGLAYFKLKEQRHSDHTIAIIEHTANTPAVTMSPKVVAPARVIPTDITHDIHKALAERQEKLQQASQLTENRGQTSKINGNSTQP